MSERKGEKQSDERKNHLIYSLARNLSGIEWKQLKTKIAEMFEIC